MRFSILFLSFLLTTQNTFASSPTIERIQKTRTLKIGYNEKAVPFSYIDQETQIPRGYGIEIAQEIAKSIQQELKIPDLKIEHVTFTVQNRWDLHAKGEVDLACIAVTNTAERQNQYVSFSYGFFATGARILVPKSLGAKNYRDLAGKTIGIPKTSASSSTLLSKKEYFKFKHIELTSSLQEAFELLNRGEVDAIVYDDVALASLLFRNSAKQDTFEIIGKPISSENYGCTLQKDDIKFKQLVNQSLGKLITSKEIYNIYDKWFMHPIPPNNQTFNFPLNQATKHLFTIPNDKAVGQF